MHTIKIAAACVMGATFANMTDEAKAADVDFSATLLNECTLALTTPGVMALSASGTVLASSEIGGVPAVLTVLSLGQNTLTVNAPTVVSAPAEYDASGETVEVAYTGASGLSLVSQEATDQTTTQSLGVIPLSALTVNAQVTNTGSFAAGDYTVRSVVTCS